MRLPRLHLVELEDQQWFPRILRDFAIKVLGELHSFGLS